MKLQLNKFVSVGPFSLGSNVTDYPFDFEVEFDPTYGDSYILPHLGLSLVVDNNNCIDFIICRSELIIDEVNIIGLAYKELVSHLDVTYKVEVEPLDFEDDNIPQLVYELDQWGLQIWTKGDIIVTAIMNDGDEEE